MSSQRQHKIPKEQWEGHKDLLQRLYLDNNRGLKGQNGVVEMMRQEGFSASPAQYEAQFKKWGFRKYLTKEEWRCIAQTIKRRKDNGRQSVVYAFQHRISDSKVHKEIVRHHVATDLVASPEGFSEEHDSIPKDFIVRSPSPSPSDTPAGPSLRNVSPNSSLVQSRIEHIVSPSNSNPHHDPGSPFNHELALDEFPENFGLPNAFQLSPGPFERDLNTSLTLSNDGIPYVFQLSPGPELFCENAAVPFDLLRQLPTDFMSTLLSLNIKSSGLNPPTVSSNELYTKHRLSILTKSLLPSWLEVRLGKEHIDTVVFKTAVLQLVNNMIRIDLDPINVFLSSGVSKLDPMRTRRNDAWKNSPEYLLVQILLEFLERDSPRRLTKLCNLFPVPYSDSLKRTLFRFALMARARLVTQSFTHMILDAGAVVETDLLSNLASIVDFNTTKKILLQLDSSHPKHMRDYRPNVLERISCGFLSQSRGAVFDGCYEILDLIMQCNPESPAQARYLGDWICLNDRRIMELILDRAPEPKSATLVQWLETSQLILHAAESLDEGLSEWVFRMLLPRLPDFRPHNISWALSYASDLVILRNHYKVLYLLLEASVQPSTETLTVAVYRRDQDFIRRLLNRGANPHAIHSDHNIFSDIRVPDAWRKEDSINSFPGKWFEATTAYAEAIRIGFSEGTRLFDTICPTDILSSSPRSVCILLAAFQSGMIELVNSYLDGTLLEDCKSINIDEYQLDSCNFGGSVALSVTHDCLLFAINYRHEHIVHKLLEAGILINADHLILAMHIKDAALTHELLEYCDQHGFHLEFFPRLFDAALKWADTVIVQKILKLGHDYPMGVADAMLLVAIEHQDRISIQRLLDAGANINIRHLEGANSPLKAAVETNNSSLVDYVIFLGADPYNSAALTTAITASRTDIVESLLAAFEKRFPKSRGRHILPGLRIAVDRNDLSLVEALVPHTNLNWMEDKYIEYGTGSYAFSPLGAAIIKPKSDALVMMQVLLNLKADPNTIAFMSKKDTSGISGSPLQLAIHEDSTEKVNLLLKYGVNINLKPHQKIKQTPLQYACMLGRYNMAVSLLEQGADANAPASFNGGGTALQFAAIGGFTGIVELLLHHHADVNAPSSKLNGRTCFEGATENGRLDMMVFLMKNGVDIVSDGGNQYRRAIGFAEQNYQIPAKKLAEELYKIAKNVSESAGAQGWDLDLW